MDHDRYHCGAHSSVRRDSETLPNRGTAFDQTRFSGERTAAGNGRIPCHSRPQGANRRCAGKRIRWSGYPFISVRPETPAESV